MTLGERLLEYRTNAKLSQDALAEKIGVTRQTISKWETDQSTPEFNKILPLCELYGITTDELIKGENKKVQEDIKEENVISYNEKRNKLKATVISVSVALYCIGAFIPIYLIDVLNYSEEESIFILLMLWTIATIILIYFFISHPKEKSESEKVLERKSMYKEEKNVKRIELMVLEIIALIFLIIYLCISFTTMAWNITWILWIVFVLVELIVKLIFDIKKGENNGK
ncbi:MAG: helix-turn-helix domain-containing protein [Clostridia bacterium]|nr:helix-turn-helix domain-containing protein [Clostridia bacterium]